MISVWEKLATGYYDPDKSSLSRQEARELEGEIVDQFKADVEEEYGTKDWPSARKMWEFAWEEGHSSGFNEVLLYYDDIYDIVRLERADDE